MSQIFHRSTNTIARVTIFGSVFLLAGALWGLAVINRSGYVTQADTARQQPVPFSHKHHVGELGLDCRYCHTSVEVSASTGIPSTQICMNCHREIWSDSPILEPVRASYRTGAPIDWVRVHDLPDFVYFDHSIHVHKGIGCVTCHGRVDEMNLTYQKASLQMEWCLDCHRNPEKYVRPREEVFNLDWMPRDGHRSGAELAADYAIESRDDCSVCHR